MAVYLLHFEQPYKHAKHYLGFSNDLESRLLAHHNGGGARLTQVVKNAGISWILARVWPNGDLALEKRLKRWHGSTKLCPICKQQAIVERFGLQPIEEMTLFDD